jgi:hypothetical protein
MRSAFPPVERRAVCLVRAILMMMMNSLYFYGGYRQVGWFGSFFFVVKIYHKEKVESATYSYAV